MFGTFSQMQQISRLSQTRAHGTQTKQTCFVVVDVVVFHFPENHCD